MTSPSDFASRVFLVGRMVDRTRAPDRVVIKALVEISKRARSHQELDQVQCLLERAREKYVPWFEEKVVTLRPKLD